MKFKKIFAATLILSTLTCFSFSQKKTSAKNTKTSTTTKKTAAPVSKTPTTTKTEEAKKAVDKLKKNPNPKKNEPVVVYNEDFEKGEELFQLNKPKEAIVYFEKALEKENVDPKVYIYLGVCYYQIENYDKSLAVCVQGMAKEGTDKKILAYNAGNSCYALGNYMRADASYAIALSEDENYSPAVLNRANALLKLDHLGDARINYRKYLDLEPNTPQRERIEIILKLLDEEIVRRENEKPELVNAEFNIEKEKIELPTESEKVTFDDFPHQKADDTRIPSEIVKNDSVAPSLPKEIQIQDKKDEEKIKFEGLAQEVKDFEPVPKELVLADGNPPQVPEEWLKLKGTPSSGEKAAIAKAEDISENYNIPATGEKFGIDDDLKKFEEENRIASEKARREFEDQKAREAEDARKKAEKDRIEKENKRIAEENRKAQDALFAEENRRKSEEDDKRKQQAEEWLKAAEERLRQIEEKARLAEEAARLAEERRKKSEEEWLLKEKEALRKRELEAEIARIEEQNRIEAARKAEEERQKREKEYQQRKALEDEIARIEELKRREAALKAEEERLQKEKEAMQRQALEAEIARIEEQKRQEAARRAEEERIQKEKEAMQRQTLENEIARIEEQKRQEAARKAEEERIQKEKEERQRKELEAEIARLEELKRQEEAKKQAEELQKKAEEEAKKKAAEELRKKEEEEAKKQALAEAQRQAEIKKWPAPKASLKVKGGEKFTPDGDGRNDTVTFYPEVKYLEEDPENWSLLIKDPQGNPFRSIKGDGKLPDSIEWDGKSENGEVVVSRNTYTANLSVVPSEKDRLRTKKIEIDSTSKIQTGLLLEVIVPGHEWKIVVQSIAFDPNGSGFEKVSKSQKMSNSQTLDEVAQEIKELAGSDADVNVIIEGYANNISGTEKEQREELLPLSQKRAEAIVNELVKRGIDRKLLTPKGLGGKNPIASKNDKANWWKNRRVEFRITQ